MLKKLTRAEAHKAMDEGKVIVNMNSRKAWRDDDHYAGPYIVCLDNGTPYRMDNAWTLDWYLEVEEPWRPVEGEAVYYRQHKGEIWTYGNISHIAPLDTNRPFVIAHREYYGMIAPVKSNEGSAGTTKELKNTLTAEDLKCQ